MVGASGNGKRETIKSLEKASGKTSHTKIFDEFEMVICQHHQTKLSLYHGVNVVEHNATEEGASQQANLVMENWKVGFNAIALVIYVSNLFQGLTNPLNLLMHAFGKKTVRDYGICIVTGADEFENRMRRMYGPRGKEFLRWCEEQEGHIKEFLDVFSPNRIILFDIDMNKEEYERQLLQVLQCVDNLPEMNVKYTYDTHREEKDVTQVRLLVFTFCFIYS